MREIKTEYVTKFLHEAWLPSSPAERYQSIAILVFGVPIDLNYGKIVEQKESGGIRLLPVPENCRYPGIVEHLQDVMKERGWEIHPISLPRSTLSQVTYEHAGKGLRVISTAMPEDDAILFTGLLAHNIERMPDEVVGEYLREVR